MQPIPRPTYLLMKTNSGVGRTWSVCGSVGRAGPRCGGMSVPAFRGSGIFSQGKNALAGFCGSETSRQVAGADYLPQNQGSSTRCGRSLILSGQDDEGMAREKLTSGRAEILLKATWSSQANWNRGMSYDARNGQALLLSWTFAAKQQTRVQEPVLSPRFGHELRTPFNLHSIST